MCLFWDLFDENTGKAETPKSSWSEYISGQQLSYHYGIREIVLHWFKGYRTDRHHHVKYNNTASNMKRITLGVPQGFILAPSLFLIKHQWYCVCVKCSFIYSFADNTTLFFSSKMLMYCISKCVFLYNFGNKCIVIVVVIDTLTRNVFSKKWKWMNYKHIFSNVEEQICK